MSHLRVFCLLACSLAISQYLPVTMGYDDNYTCRHNKSFKKEEWKQCKRMTIPNYSDVHRNFADEILTNTVNDDWLKVEPK